VEGGGPSVSKLCGGVARGVAATREKFQIALCVFLWFVSLWEVALKKGGGGGRWVRDNLVRLSENVAESRWNPAVRQVMAVVPVYMRWVSGRPMRSAMGPNGSNEKQWYGVPLSGPSLQPADPAARETLAVLAALQRSCYW
jgi:hypothetical protein